MRATPTGTRLCPSLRIPQTSRTRTAKTKIMIPNNMTAPFPGAAQLHLQADDVAKCEHEELYSEKRLLLHVFGTGGGTSREATRVEAGSQNRRR
jgi:hypothetical protein